MVKTIDGEPPNWKEFREKLARGEATIDFAPATRGALLYEIPHVLFGIRPLFCSDQSHLGDFMIEIDDEARNAAREAWGIEIPEDEEKQYLWYIADLITGVKPS